MAKLLALFVKPLLQEVQKKSICPTSVIGMVCVPCVEAEQLSEHDESVEHVVILACSVEMQLKIWQAISLKWLKKVQWSRNVTTRTTGLVIWRGRVTLFEISLKLWLVFKTTMRRVEEASALVLFSIAARASN